MKTNVITLLIISALAMQACGTTVTHKHPRQVCVVIDRYVAADREEARKAALKLRMEPADNETQRLLDDLSRLREENPE